MMRRLAIILALLAVTACASTIAPCDTVRDGGIGGTGACATAPPDI